MCSKDTNLRQHIITMFVAMSFPIDYVLYQPGFYLLCILAKGGHYNVHKGTANESLKKSQGPCALEEVA